MKNEQMTTHTQSYKQHTQIYEHDEHMVFYKEEKHSNIVHKSYTNIST